MSIHSIFQHIAGMEKALKHYTEAWDRVKSGDFYDEANNNVFDYMLHTLWHSHYKSHVKTDILKHLNSLLNNLGSHPNPPPFILILISLHDTDIIKLIQEHAIIDFIKTNASEDAAFNILNLIETFSEKNVNINSFVHAVANNIKPTMHTDIVEAVAHITTMRHPQYTKVFLNTFLSMKDHRLLKAFVSQNRVAMLELLNVMRPGEVQKLLG
jgi:hypothetical protein